MKHKISKVVSSLIIGGAVFIASLEIALNNVQIAEASILALNQCDWMALVIQIQNDPTTLDLCSEESSNFNSQAAVLLFEHSNIDNIRNAELVVNFKLNQGILYFNVGLEGREGIHLSLSSKPLT
jgi:hypothetical protein